MIAAYMDSTNLKAEATRDDINKLCSDAVRLQMAAICVTPYRLPIAAAILQGTAVKKCTVIGFPLGAERLEAKYSAARIALQSGADELDMVINVGALKDRDYQVVSQEIAALCQLKEEFPFLLKIIVETALLSEEELVTATKIISASQADFIKTSTGFAARGASLNDINLISRYKSEQLKIKASGSIRTLESALAFIAAGADRIGSSNAAAIVEDYRKRGGLLRR